MTADPTADLRVAIDAFLVDVRDRTAAAVAAQIAESGLPGIGIEVHTYFYDSRVTVIAEPSPGTAGVLCYPPQYAPPPPEQETTTS